MQELTIFKNESFGEIRTQIIKGEPYFCLADVCKILDLTTPAKVIQRLNTPGMSTIHIGVKTGVKRDGSDATQKVKMTFINEGNLCQLPATYRSGGL